jgi:hypothetical protein
MLEENKDVHRIAMENYLGLGLVGRVVLSHGKVIAYTFGYEISKDMFCVLFEVTDPSIAGLPSFIFSEFANDEDIKKYTTINTMDDMFLGNVRRTKELMHPFSRIPVYAVTKNI